MQGYPKNVDNTCNCETEPQIKEHLMCCLLLEQKCTSDDLAGYNENAKKYVQLWLKLKHIWYCVYVVDTRNKRITRSRYILIFLNQAIKRNIWRGVRGYDFVAYINIYVTMKTLNSSFISIFQSSDFMFIIFTFII